MIPAPAKRIVLDTNVCLDLFVFHDPRWSKLLAAIESGEVEALTRPPFPSMKQAVRCLPPASTP